MSLSESLLTEAAERADSDEERASALNNRAQVRRLRGEVEGAKKDLEEAISLSGRGGGKVARQALCQRGELLM